MKKNYFLIVSFILLMAITRSSHIGSAFSLPDASLAVFFLTGLCYQQRSFFTLLLVEAGLIDYVAISQFNVSDFCISPAYVFLIPTYGVMWFAGRFCSNLKSMKDREMTLSISTLSILLSATTLAFLISSGSFYLLSDHIKTLSWHQFIEICTTYLPHYVSSTMIYCIVVYAFIQIIELLPTRLLYKTA